MATFNDKYLRVPEFAAENGVSVATVYRWWAAGEGPKSTRLGPAVFRPRRAKRSDPMCSSALASLARRDVRQQS